MAISLPSEPSPSVSCAQHARRPSLYAAFTVACIVQTFKERLRAHQAGSKILDQSALIKHSPRSFRNHGSAKKPGSDRGSLKSGSDPPLFDLPFRKRSFNIKCIKQCQESTALCRHFTKEGNNTRILLKKLDEFAQPQRVATPTIAADDTLFLQYDPRHDVASKNITVLGNILDLTTALLFRLQPNFTDSGSLDTNDCELLDILGQNHDSDPKNEQSIANLIHMLRCLQYAALEALAFAYLKVVEADFVNWRSLWQQRWQTGAAWFTEWPGGRRPLSTTWPWNVRPSLLVLWGVCWMFYGNDGTPRNTEATGFPSAVVTLNRQSPQSSPHFNSSNYEIWPTTAPTNPHRLVESYPEVTTRNTYRIPDYYTLPAFTSVSSSPYISASPSTSSASFGTLTDFWPHNQGINTGINASSNYTYARNFNLSQSPQAQNGQALNFPRSVPALEAANAVNPYAQYNQAITYETRETVTGSEPSLGQPSSNMQGYPSPHSDMSDHRISPCPSGLPGANVTPVTVPYTTTSRASSTYGSPRSARSEEPTRNDEGLMYCNHEKCADEPPTFTRKCEWSKHMDKHNRPYICEERGCEKILGFTYSGGLLRHQREVHRQHGGPKAPSMCPHPDCKRSTGTGFSRRENLLEHLRRVHRGVGGESTDTPQPKERKRRRPVNDDEKEEKKEPSEESKRRKTGQENDAATDDADACQDETTDLRAKVKQLEVERQQQVEQIWQQNERIRKLEEMYESLTKGQ